MAAVFYPQTMYSATTTTMSTTARPPKRTPVPLLLEAFPVPPTHIPPTPTTPTNNPPPTGPPSLPLPPVPGPSRISEHEQVLLLTTATRGSRRSSKYSVTSSSQRESVASLGSTHGHSGGGGGGGSSSGRTSVASSGGKSPALNVSSLPAMSQSPTRASRSSGPRSPSSLSRPSISVSAPSGRLTPGDQLTRLSISPIPLSDIEDEDAEAPPPRMPSPSLQASWRRSKQHHANESISSIDVRDILGVEVDVDGADEAQDVLLPFRARAQPSPRATAHVHHMSVADPIDPQTLLSQLELLPARSPTSSMATFSYPKHTKSPSDSRKLSALSQPPNNSSSSNPPSPFSAASSIMSMTDPSLTTSMSTTTQISSSTSVNSMSSTEQPVLPSPTIKDLRMEMRAERTKSAGLKKSLAVRSRSRSRAGERSPMPMPDVALPPIPGAPVGLGLEMEEPISLGDAALGPILVTKTTTTTTVVAGGKGQAPMTLDELGPPKTPAPQSKAKKSLYSKPRSAQNSVSSTKLPSKTKSPMSDSRSSSPDIDSILSSTPRPALRKSSRSRVRSQATSRSRANSTTSNPVMRRRASEGVAAHSQSMTSWDGQEPSELPYTRRTSAWSRSSQSVSHGAEVEYDEAMERMLEGQGSEDELSDGPRGRQRGRRKDDGGGDSDSSLDIHTPLPHLMVRDGLLSPNSRLLPGSSRATTPMDGRPGSTMSMASTMTKSGIFKDERDTPMRRVRHRDNKMLRGGIGLTTGLGWSDSEDEDAPSPLTRRLSSLNLTRQPSSSSLKTNGSVKSRRHPLSRSYSSGALLESEHEKFDDFDDVDPTPHSRPPLPSSTRTSRSSLPPTSWQKKSATPNRSSTGARTSTSSVGSTLSLEVTIPDVPRSRTPSRIGKLNSTTRDSTGSSLDHHDRPTPKKRRSGEDVRTPSSTTSTFSIPMPSTPKDYDPALSTPLAHKKPFDKEKTLPPLPAGGLKKTASGSRKESTTSAYGFPRARTFSSTSSVSASTPSPLSASSSPVVRPLQLPRQAARSSAGDRAAVPVPSVLSSSASQSSLRTPRSPQMSPVSPNESVPSSPPLPSGVPSRPKPRTGTGMVYRTTSSVGSRMRAPMVLSSSTSASAGKPAASAAALGSIGRASSASKVPPL